MGDQVTVLSVGDVLYVRCSFQGRLHPFRSPVDESKKSIVRFFKVLIVPKNSMRFDEGKRSYNGSQRYKSEDPGRRLPQINGNTNSPSTRRKLRLQSPSPV
jgi:hypothetical protein